MMICYLVKFTPWIYNKMKEIFGDDVVVNYLPFDCKIKILSVEVRDKNEIKLQFSDHEVYINERMAEKYLRIVIPDYLIDIFEGLEITEIREK